MYKHILVPLDGSKLAEQVLPLVGHLQAAFSSQVVLLSVVSEAAPLGTVGAVSSAKEYLATIAGRLPAGTNEVSTIVRAGFAAETILTEAESAPETLIAMTTHGHSGAERFLLGSVTDKVLHGTTLPVLLLHVQPDHAAAAALPATLVVTLDGSPLAEEVLPHVAALARDMDMKVILARVVATPYAMQGWMWEGGAAYLPDDFDALDAETQDYLEAKAKELRSRGLRVETQTLHGTPASALLDLVAGTPNCMIALSSHGRSGLGRWALGSVADRLVTGTSVPVLLIRPSLVQLVPPAVAHDLVSEPYPATVLNEAADRSAGQPV